VSTQLGFRSVVDERDTFRKAVKWYKTTALEVLEEKTWAGKYIPVVPCYGAQVIVDDKRKKYGLGAVCQRPAADVQLLAHQHDRIGRPSAKGQMAIGRRSGRGHENDGHWLTSSPALCCDTSKRTSKGVHAPVPTRLQPEPPPAGHHGSRWRYFRRLANGLGHPGPERLPSGQYLRARRWLVSKIRWICRNFHFSTT